MTIDTWVYRPTQDGKFAVGYFRSNGEFFTDSTHDTRVAARSACAALSVGPWLYRLADDGVHYSVGYYDPHGQWVEDCATQTRELARTAIAALAAPVSSNVSDMIPATNGADGIHGLAPTPACYEGYGNRKYLASDGQWYLNGHFPGPFMGSMPPFGTPTAGDAYFDPSSGNLYVFDGSNWKTFAPSV
ncbi:MAG TPA: hypothetical protein VGP72_22160 [Planctomycetota bacterium]|jgi:hypothetical protein